MDAIHVERDYSTTWESTHLYFGVLIYSDYSNGLWNRLWWFKHPYSNGLVHSDISFPPPSSRWFCKPSSCLLTYEHWFRWLDFIVYPSLVVVFIIACRFLLWSQGFSTHTAAVQPPTGNVSSMLTVLHFQSISLFFWWWSLLRRADWSNCTNCIFLLKCRMISDHIIRWIYFLFDVSFWNRVLFWMSLPCTPMDARTMWWNFSCSRVVLWVHSKVFQSIQPFRSIPLLPDDKCFRDTLLRILIWVHEFDCV